MTYTLEITQGITGLVGAIYYNGKFYASIGAMNEAEIREIFQHFLATR